MPIYEYFCPDNNRIYQFFAKTVAQGEPTPKCPLGQDDVGLRDQGSDAKVRRRGSRGRERSGWRRR